METYLSLRLLLVEVEVENIECLDIAGKTVANNLFSSQPEPQPFLIRPRHWNEYHLTFYRLLRY